MKSNNVTFLGIGAQKCASTWVYKILQEHPDVFVSDPKELDFFSHNYNCGFQWYLKYFNEGIDKKIFGEISPSYFYDRSAPKRVFDYNPEMKIIITLRDPIDRAYSNHLHEIRIGHYTGDDLSFEAGLENNPMYVYQSLYATHLKSWLEYFGKDQLLILIQEEIGNAPLESVIKTYDFLNIDKAYKPDFLERRSNVSYSEKLKGIDKSLKTLGGIGRKLGLGFAINNIREHAFIRNLRALNKKHLSEDVPPMDQQTRIKLEKLFVNEIDELKILIGRDDVPWKTKYASKK